ncbi:MAG: hypothetical protein U5J62_06135 [Desulfurivibrio sp.]|nr:hypothetical protein [Desulfurivibrio sp.]
MQNFMLTVLLAGVVMVGFLLLLNFCRRRLQKTPHGLTGMCHQDGGRLCASCTARIDRDGKAAAHANTKTLSLMLGLPSR